MALWYPRMSRRIIITIPEPLDDTLETYCRVVKGRSVRDWVMGLISSAVESENVYRRAHEALVAPRSVIAEFLPLGDLKNETEEDSAD